MIQINGILVDIKHFPDGTLLLKENVEEYRLNQNTSSACFHWKFENNEELVALQFLAMHFKENGMRIRLVMPYLPNARQDRIKNDEDVFTLKHFAKIINALGFDTVVVLDPHSAVSEALFDRLIVRHPESYMKQVLDKVDGDITLFYPDEGAMKRYSSMVKRPYCFGIKKRDWVSGKILGLDVIGDSDLIQGKDILIIDDICSKGGTFYHSAKKLKELGAEKIYLYVTHCENTIFQGELLTNGLVEKVFTTDSLYTGKHEKVEVLENAY